MDKFHYYIRPANVSDADAIARIGFRSWNDTYRGLIPDEYLNDIDLNKQVVRAKERIQEGANYIVACDERAHVVGYCAYGLTKEAILHPGEYEISSLYITDSMRSKGIGGILLFEAERRMPTPKPIMIRVLKGNLKARKFFEDNGYRYVPGRDGMFRNLVPDVAYLKKV